MINKAETIIAHNSAAVTAHHMPFKPSSSGKAYTAISWNNILLKNDIAALTLPFPREVKKPDAYILKPENKKENAYSLKALVVVSISA